MAYIQDDITGIAVERESKTFASDDRSLNELVNEGDLNFDDVISYEFPRGTEKTRTP